MALEAINNFIIINTSKISISTYKKQILHSSATQVIM